jgi:hypothetical protein
LISGRWYGCTTSSLFFSFLYYSTTILYHTAVPP